MLYYACVSLHHDAVRFVGILFYPPHHTDADLEEEVKWNGDEDERHKVGRRDDGRHEHKVARC